MIKSFLAASADQIGQKACEVGGNDALGCGTGLLSPGGFVNNAINTVIIVVGALSVIMVVVGGLRYVLSGGDAQGLKSAKDTILYALVGLVIALLSYAIVGFVIGKVG